MNSEKKGMKRGENFLLYLDKKGKILSILYNKIQIENFLKNFSHIATAGLPYSKGLTNRQARDYNNAV
jgi:hypothetical protein